MPMTRMFAQIKKSKRRLKNDVGYLELFLLLSIRVKQCCIGWLSLNRKSGKQIDCSESGAQKWKNPKFAMHNASELALFKSETDDQMAETEQSMELRF